MSGKRFFLTAAAVFFLTLSSWSWAAEKEEADLERDDQGVVLGKDVRYIAPSDRKIYKIVGNVVRAEEKDSYFIRRIEEAEKRLNGKIETLQKQMNILDQRVSGLELSEKSRPAPAKRPDAAATQTKEK